MRSNSKTLKQQPSKLDLIDDTTLTSLPFPPPPPIKRPSAVASQSLSSTTTARGRGGRDSPLNQLRTVKSNHSSVNGPMETEYVGDLNFDKVGGEDVEDDEDYYEYSYEEEDPIVLVEDYLSLRESSPSYTTADTSPATSSGMTLSTCSTSSQHHLLRQKSLANFKKRVLSTSSNNSTDTIILQSEDRRDRNTIINSCGLQPPPSSSSSSSIAQQQQQPRQQSDDLQAIFGDLPSFHLLKHCDLCDKPLYEISSIINSKSNLNLNLKEFVCGDCISNYEVFMTEFIQEQQLNNKKQPIDQDVVKEPASKKIKNTKFWHVLNHISSKYNVRREVV
ncbi:hypothetical protein CANMA_004784 [Candida margitis]|uniref:uncharacterized protein n=1 Tax=Candida margitis TaxID=1775924 RepID=UPI00222664B7|nr:uncharacterized protein CANMA_004784 [Candida margitis]KAI5953945.1 hypothetical protein CANMA_004784 [Candida margitis]